MTITEKESMVLTIQQWRSLKEMTRVGLARKSGVTEKTIYNYENSQKYVQNASYQTLKKIADALQIKVDNIFLGDDSEKPKF
ncbi:helix-turn-helix transcriptional regulator [Staphylococcus pasteuri]|uniref:helix-turn-helix transcriptional regulator n=1 Tax=Staphylococcus pasteuri TaxID=45972 RepID=UPI001AD89449|nr:helix-turn-helix transcriptional regulator [Staphylococcus pasteuri]MBM6506780.1 helix-turn-helix transcriptional regulator [Staphylococcus pasteuri]QQT21451.1 helix-turn-helix transcriptional regulator [Staphylococcus pasteuri]